MKRFLLQTLLGALAVFLSFSQAMAAIYPVTRTTNAGVGSLRQAIINANTNPGRDTITFNIAVGGGNVFEGSGANTYPVIQLDSTLQAITGAVLINGMSQPNSNTGFMPGRTVGVDGLTQPNIQLPDVYITPSSAFVFPTTSLQYLTDGISVRGNCFTVRTSDVEIRGLCISGFGNTSTSQNSASSHGEIVLFYLNTPRNANFRVNNCFLGCDPLGVKPTLSQRISKCPGVLVMGNNFNGVISNNYVSSAGTYGIELNGSKYVASMLPIRWFEISDNQVYSIGGSATAYTTRIADCIELQAARYTRVLRNWCQDAEQNGIDLNQNADSNYVENNTITGNNRAVATAVPMAGIRIDLSSAADTLTKNLIFNNTSTILTAGIWIDQQPATYAGTIIHGNTDNLISQNTIHSNNASGIVLSTFNNGGTSVSCLNNTFTRNSIYNNAGLGIDLNYNSNIGPTQVTPNDDGDGDAGVNNIVNFPLIDSVKVLAANSVTVWGKGPAGSTMEFFLTDGAWNRHGGFTLNYGEGRTFIGSAVEGSVADSRAGTGSYSIDGNVATNNVNLFSFTFTYAGAITSTDSITSTATLSNNTSEFGPKTFISMLLGCIMLDFTALHHDGRVTLNWEAICDRQFAQYEIEHSADGRSFSRIGTVSDISKLGSRERYNFDHLNPAAGTNYYRLKLLNTDRSFTYSRILRVNNDDKFLVPMKISPNPVSDAINVSVTLEADMNVDFRILDSRGRVMQSRQFGGRRGTNVFSMNGLGVLSTGVYIAELRAGNRVWTEKLLRQ